MFHPNPQSMPSYGKILTDTLISGSAEETFVTSNTSKYTFLLSPLNNQFSYTTIAFPIHHTLQVETCRSREARTADAATQTEAHEEAGRYSYSSTYIESAQFALRASSASSPVYSQLPPPYPYQRQVKTEPVFRDRFERKTKRYVRGESSSNVTLAMYLNSMAAVNQPQAARGRKAKASKARRIKGDAKEQRVANVPSNSSPALNAEEFDLIDEIIAEDLREK